MDKRRAPNSGVMSTFHAAAARRYQPHMTGPENDPPISRWFTWRAKSVTKTAKRLGAEYLGKVGVSALPPNPTRGAECAPICENAG